MIRSLIVVNEVGAHLVDGTYHLSHCPIRTKRISSQGSKKIKYPQVSQKVTVIRMSWNCKDPQRVPEPPEY